MLDHEILDGASKQLILNPSTVHLERLWSGSRYSIMLNVRGAAVL